MSERGVSNPTRTRRTPTLATPLPAGVDPETGEMAPGSEIPPERAIVFLKDIQDLDRAQDELMDLQLAGEEAVSTLLYAYPEKDGGRPTGRFVVGPSADFVLQLVRQLNRASKGKMQLRLMPHAPVVQDFTAPGADGKVRAYVRVIVGVEDAITGEVAFGIKSAPRAGTDPEGVAHTRAIRRAFEVHPLYNRKKVSQFIRRKLRALHLDPAKFLVAGEGVGGGTWSEFFGRARLAGVPPEGLRQSVRDQTGQGLSQVRDLAAAGEAAVAADATIAQGMGAGASDMAVQSQGGADPGVEGARQPHSPAPETAAEASATPPAPPTPPAKQMAHPEGTGEPPRDSAEGGPGIAPAVVDVLKAKIRDHITHMGLKHDTVVTLWGQVSVRQPPEEDDFRRMLTVLQLIATGTEADQAVIQALKEDYRDPNPFA